MKLTTQYLRQLIREAIADSSPVDVFRDFPGAKRKYFGEDPNMLPCFEATKDGPDWKYGAGDNTRAGRNCMNKHKFTRLGAGAFRVTFDVPGNENLILKVGL